MTKEVKTVLSTAKTQEGKAFLQDVDVFQRIYAWEMSNIFHAKPTGIVFSVGSPSNGGKGVYCKYKADLQYRDDVSRSIILATLSPKILGDVKQVMQAIAYVCLHSVFLQEDIKILARKKGRDFRDKAKKFGFIAEKSADVNAGYEKITFTPALWQAIQPALAGLKFNLEAIPVPQEKKTDKKPVYTYIHPNGVDIVKSNNPTLDIWGKTGDTFHKWEIATDAHLERRKHLLAEQKRKTPIPGARMKTLA